MSLETIKQTLNSGTGQDLKQYLNGKLFELRNIENVKEVGGKEEQDIEFKAQKRAYNKLREILEDIMDIEEDAAEKDSRDSYEVGLEEDN